MLKLKNNPLTVIKIGLFGVPVIELILFGVYKVSLANPYIGLLIAAVSLTYIMNK